MKYKGGTIHLKAVLKQGNLKLSNLTLSADAHYDNYDKGLSEKEAQALLNKYGPNVLLQKKKVSAFKIIVDQFTNFMVLILLAATAISAFMGEMVEAVTIVAIVVLNALLGFIQEYRTERTLEALKNLSAPSARVIRDGMVHIIPASELVPSDVIIVEAGDRVPADAILIEATNLAVDESLLTGESVPVEKHPLNKYKHSKGNENRIYMGTMVTYGRGKAIVCATGMKTEMGKIADMIQGIEDEQTPLQKRLENLGRFIVYACLAICAIVAVTGIIRGENVFTMLLAGISLAVAAVPEGLPAVVTVCLALGMQRMLKRNALIRKLPAVETLGCADVICSDKTGTLTENKMTVRKIYCDGKLYEIKGKKIEYSRNPQLKLALEISVLCNNAQLVNPRPDENTADEVIGDPTEVALLFAGAKAGITREALENKYKRIGEIPFDSERKCMSVIYRDSGNATYVFTKGAPDEILKKCTKIYTAYGVENLTSAKKAALVKINNNMAGEALRVLAVAYKELNSRQFGNLKQSGNFSTNTENELVFVGLLGMIDPPRAEALEAVNKCKIAGIKPVMITGDHKLTACAIAKEINIYNDGDIVLTGDDLDKMEDDELARIVDKVSVFARVSPKHKLKIVKAIKKQGHVVAMTGDGVNDAPAVKEADIGVSMGIIGTDVTKEASSMILMDDNFATIVAAVEEGRVIYSNIRKFIRYLLSCNIGEVLTMFVGMLIGLPVPLLPIQILWVNLVTDGLPAIALGLEPAEKDIMMRPPRGADENVFSNGLLKVIMLRGILLGASTLGVFISMYHLTDNVALARTGAFVTLMFTQLIHVFECKSENKSIFEIPLFNNIFLVLAVLCSITMILSVIYIPQLRAIFRTVSLALEDWMIIIGFSWLGPVLSSLFGKKRS